MKTEIFCMKITTTLKSEDLDAMLHIIVQNGRIAPLRVYEKDNKTNVLFLSHKENEIDTLKDIIEDFADSTEITDEKGRVTTTVFFGIPENDSVFRVDNLKDKNDSFEYLLLGDKNPIGTIRIVEESSGHSFDDGCGLFNAMCFTGEFLDIAPVMCLSFVYHDGEDKRLIPYLYHGATI